MTKINLSGCKGQCLRSNKTNKKQTKNESKKLKHLEVVKILKGTVFSSLEFVRSVRDLVARSSSFRHSVMCPVA